MAYLERKDASRNMHRFYSLSLEPTLFGTWALVRRWGRIGAKGRKMEQWFADQDDAKAMHQKLIIAKKKKGYTII